MASRLSIQVCVILMSTQSHWHLNLLYPHHFVWCYQCNVCHSKCCTLTNLYVLSDALWLAGRLRAADKVNLVNMARDKAIPKGTITTKLAHRVQGMEVHVLFIFCALGSAAIPHVSCKLTSSAPALRPGKSLNTEHYLTKNICFLYLLSI